VETKHLHLGADNENPATPIRNQIKIFSDMLKLKEDAYRKKTFDFNTIKLKVKNARSKMAYLEREAINIQKENLDLEQQLGQLLLR
jgi:hypothetical protein